jgi:hypothetical protein
VAKVVGSAVVTGRPLPTPTFRPTTTDTAAAATANEAMTRLAADIGRGVAVTYRTEAATAATDAGRPKVREVKTCSSVA